MINKKITPHIYISEDKSWGNYTEFFIFDIIRNIEKDFTDSIGTKNIKDILLFHKSNGPLCMNNGNYRIIFLSTKSNHFCQWVYQFAHEYCHHLIDGTMCGEIKGLLWFEETICELASIYHLNRYYKRCTTDILLQNLAPAVLDYLHDLYTKNVQLVELFHQEYLNIFLDQLGQPVYHREIYNAIAVSILPLFEENPSLWKMILNFGDIRKWNSLEELFEHLLQCSTDDYRNSLLLLKNKLLGS